MHEPSTPQPFGEADAVLLLVAWETCKQWQRGIKIQLRPWPNCCTCGAAVDEVLTTRQLTPVGEHLVAFKPCGHCFTLADETIARLHSDVMDMVRSTF